MIVRLGVESGPMSRMEDAILAAYTLLQQHDFEGARPCAYWVLQHLDRADPSQRFCGKLLGGLLGLQEFGFLAGLSETDERALPEGLLEKVGRGETYSQCLCYVWYLSSLRFHLEILAAHAFGRRQQIKKKLTKLDKRLASRFEDYPTLGPHRLRELALCANLLGQPEKARKLFRKSFLWARDCGLEFETAWTQREQQRVARLWSWPEADEKSWEEAERRLAKGPIAVPSVQSIEAETRAPEQNHKKLMREGRKVVQARSLEALKSATFHFSRALLGDLVERVDFGNDGEFVLAEQKGGTKLSLKLMRQPTELDELMLRHLRALTQISLRQQELEAEESSLKKQRSTELAMFRQLFQNAPVPQLIADSTFRILLSNLRFDALFPDVISLEELLSSEGFVGLQELSGRNLRLTDREGLIRWFEFRCQEIADNEVLISLIESSAEMRKTLAAFHSLEERVMAAELHDGLSGPLATMFYGLQLAQASASTKPRDADEILAGVSREARAVIPGLGKVKSLLRLPPERNLSEALGQYFESLQGFQVHFQDKLEMQTNELTTSFSFRIVQEAISNARRHSGEEQCWVDIGQEGQELRLEVRDEGRGFEMGASLGLGTRTMQERAEFLGGSFGIESQPDEGTKIRVRLPLSGVVK